MRIITEHHRLRNEQERIRIMNTPPPMKYCGYCGCKAGHSCYYGEYGEHLCWNCFAKSRPDTAEKYYPVLYADWLK